MGGPEVFSIDAGTFNIILEMLGYAGTILIGWLVKLIFDRIKEIKADNEARLKDLEKELEKLDAETNKLNIVLPTQYVNKLEFSRVIDELFGELKTLGVHIDDNKDNMNNKLERILATLHEKKNKE